MNIIPVTKYKTSDNQLWESEDEAKEHQNVINFVSKLKEFEKKNPTFSFGINDKDYQKFYRIRYELKEFLNINLQ